MKIDYIANQIIKSNQKNTKRKNHIKVGLIILIISLFFLYYLGTIIFADPAVPSVTPDNEIYFEFDHNLTDAGYKYYGYGYTLSVFDNEKKIWLPLQNGMTTDKTQYFMKNAEFKPIQAGSKETVKIPMENVYKQIGLNEEYYWHNNLTVYLNARIGIRVNKLLTHLYDTYDGNPSAGLNTVPIGSYTPLYPENHSNDKPVVLNKDGKGILDGIKYEYGIDWSGTTRTNLKKHFGIKLNVQAVYKWDRYKIVCVDEATGKEIKSTNDMSPKKIGNVPVYPETVTGYTFNNQYKIDVVDKNNRMNVYQAKTDGSSCSVPLKQESKRYIVTFYYTKQPTTGTPIDVNVEYRLSSRTGKELIDGKTVKGYVNSQFSLSSEKIDEYVCKKYIMIGQTEYEAEGTALSVKLNSEKWNTPSNGKLKVIFIYEKAPIIVAPKCEPIFDGTDGCMTLDMKMSKFQAMSELYVNNATFGIENVKVGLDRNRNPVEGEHAFSTFDFYVYNKGKGGQPFEALWDNTGHNANLSFSVQKFMFSKVNDNLWSARIPIDYVTFCTCKGAGFDVGFRDFVVNINVIENKPPTALFFPCTEILQSNGSIRTLYEIYVNYEATLSNHADDPNGIEDIEYIHYTLIDSNNNRYYVKLSQNNGMYNLEDDNVNEASNIVLNGITSKGDLKLRFKTNETWTVNQLVRDTDGEYDIYTDVITPIEPDFSPIAILDDISSYRYPSSIIFSGKQNRVVGLSSNSSKVANLLLGTGVEIDHSKDSIEIIPLNNQSLNSIYFDNDLKKEIKNNTLIINNVDFRSQKLMFKEVGQYKVRLQVTDTDGNVSKWVEKIFTIVEDKAPTATATCNLKNYRNEIGIATVTLKDIVPKSTDDDYAVIEKIKYRYDSNNDGVFTNETLVNLSLSNGQVSFTSKELGKYQFVIIIKENFGQPTLVKYIGENDYKKTEVTFTTEIDNIAPDVTKFQIKRKNEE